MASLNFAEAAVLVARGKHGLGGKGKLRHRRMLPLLKQEFALHGIELKTAVNLFEARAAIESGAQIVINVFNELHELDEILIQDEDLPSHIAINPLRLREILNNKTVLSERFQKNSIPVPSDSKVAIDWFQIYATGTSVPPKLLADGEKPEYGHHVTKYIETSRPFKGKVYRTYVRLFAVGEHLIAANVGIRPWSENDLSVHLIDTPLDVELISHFQTLLVDRNIDRFISLAKKLGACLGPGIFTHDIVIEAETQEIFVCETGIKFDIGAVENHFQPIKSEIPALDFHPENFCKSLVCGIIQCVKSQGFWNRIGNS